jgi:putative SOS response-associated peptidase YedK
MEHLAPVVIDPDGIRVVERLRWGMPGPIFPAKPGEKPKRPGRVTNVRSTKSGHWRPWLGHIPSGWNQPDGICS